MSLSSSKSEILALCFESIVYGIFVTIFAISIRVFTQRYKEVQFLNVVLMVTSVLLFALITWHIAIDLVRVLIAFNGKTIADADLYYLNFQSVLPIMKTSIYAAITFLSDAFIMSRTYIIWSRRMSVMIVPIILFLGDTVTGIAAVVSLAKLDPTQTIFIERQAGFTLSFFSLTVALNVLCTALIAGRIWNTQRKTAKFVQIINSKRNSRLGNITSIILESGAIYSITLILVVVSYTTQTFAAFNVFLDLTSPVIGIVFSSIIVRASLGYAPEGAPATISTVEFATNSGGGRTTRVAPVNGNMNATFELSSMPRLGVAPQVKTVIEQERDTSIYDSDESNRKIAEP